MAEVFGFIASCLLMAAVLGSSDHTPEQVHIAIGEKSNEIIIKWSTQKNIYEATVKYKEANEEYLTEYGVIEEFLYPSTEDRVQYIYTVKLTALKHQTKYYYKVGSSHFSFSEEFFFITWPEGIDWSPNILVYGDFGLTNSKSLNRLIEEAQTENYHAVVHVGDFAYDLHSHDGTTGDKFMNKIQPIASQLPYITCPGNHEIKYRFKSYRSIFSMPGDRYQRGFFSFKLGSVHFISISTEIYFTPEYGEPTVNDQYEWLEKELKEANKKENRAKYPWIVIYGHRPMYCSNNNKRDCTKHESIIRVGMKCLHYKPLEKLIYEHGVDIAIWAHEHSYERLWPVYNRKVRNGSEADPYVMPKAPVHIITGSAGCREDLSRFHKDVAAWSAFRSTDYGYTRMKAFNASHLQIEQVSDDKGGVVIDRIMVVKDSNHSPYPHNDEDIEETGDLLKDLNLKCPGVSRSSDMKTVSLFLFYFEITMFLFV